MTPDELEKECLKYADYAVSKAKSETRIKELADSKGLSLDEFHKQQNKDAAEVAEYIKTKRQHV